MIGSRITKKYHLGKYSLLCTAAAWLTLPLSYISDLFISPADQLKLFIIVNFLLILSIPIFISAGLIVGIVGVFKNKQDKLANIGVWINSILLFLMVAGFIFSIIYSLSEGIDAII